jgi:hypothetical protein
MRSAVPIWSTPGGSFFRARTAAITEAERHKAGIVAKVVRWGGFDEFHNCQAECTSFCGEQCIFAPVA